MKDNKLSNSKAVAYCRTTEAIKEKSKLSLELQKQKIVQTAQVLNVEIVKWFEQVDASQPVVITEILNYCKANPDIKFVLAIRPDLLSRSLEQYVQLVLELKKVGVSIKFVDCICDDLALKNLDKAIGLALVQHYHDRLSESIKEGLRRKKQSLHKTV